MLAAVKQARERADHAHADEQDIGGPVVGFLIGYPPGTTKPGGPFGGRPASVI